MERLGFRAASLDDLELLASMNRQLILDEGSRNPMDHPALVARMRGWLSDTWRAIIVYVGDEPAGYCLYQQRHDEYDSQAQVIYVRQFFVARERRRLGIGQRAFQRIADVVFPDNATLELDVLAGNEAGRAFWSSLGFVPHGLTVKRRSRDSSSAAQIETVGDDGGCAPAPRC